MTDYQPNLRDHERWWEDHADPDGLFRTWLEESDPTSRAAVVQMVHQMGARSVLEAGPGLFHDYQTYWLADPLVSYRAVELTPKLVQYGRDLFAEVVQGSILDIPLEDDTVDVAYTRHVLEHLAPHEWARALRELVRVSRMAAIVVFFRTKAEGDHEWVRDTTAAPGTFCNCLSRAEITAFVETIGLKAAWSCQHTDWVLAITW